MSDLLGLINSIPSGILSMIGIFTIIAVVSFIQCCKAIKLRPWSMLFSALGKALTADIKEDLKEIKSEQHTIKVDLMNHVVNSQRRSILDFANALTHNEEKIKEDFDNIIETHDEYEQYLKKNNLKNGKVNLAFDLIKKKYSEKLESNTFL